MKLAHLSIFLALPLMFGCARVSNPALPPPPLLTGAVNKFDQDSYKTLLAVQASYNNLLSSYNANKAGLSGLKAPLDQAATDYNLAELAWQVYHAAATTANQAALTSSLNKVQADISAIKVTP